MIKTLDLSKSVEEISFDLISIESVTRNEENIANIIEITLKKYSSNLDITRIDNSIILKLNLHKDKTVALVGHIDTVPLTRKNQTTPTVKDGKLIGLGACDMKSGVASMLKIFYEIEVDKSLSTTHNLSLIFYEAEEGPLPNGINKLIDNKLLNSIDFAFVLEPTEGRYSVGCLGTVTVKKEVQGISAHSANPKTGKNAIGEAIKIYKAIEEADKSISKTQSIDGLPYYETINITQFTTENAGNVLPPKCYISINFRFSPNRTSDEAEQFIYDLIGGNDGVYFVDKCLSCYAGVAVNNFLHDNGPKREIMQAWTDIAQLNDAGIPAINFGAGSIKVAHKPEEFIDIKELQEFYELLKTHI